MDVITGEFDAEKHWTDPNLCTLPSMIKGASVSPYMDEIMFMLANKNDLLITEVPFNEDFRTYLKEIGIEFSVCTENNFKSSDISSLYMKNFIPFSVTPKTEKIYKSTNWINTIPKLDNVKKVNSKKFSMLLSKKLECNPYKSFDCITINQIEQIFDNFPCEPIIIKEYMGVSGRGSLVLNTNKSRNSILKHIAKEEIKGKSIGFIIEPYLNKLIDFSTHICISPSGIIDIQETNFLLNKGTFYLGNGRTDNDLIKFLHNNNYYSIIKTAAKELYAEGYWGDICIDSMILKYNILVPLIEINARKSMGILYNSFANSIEVKFGKKYSVLRHINVGMPQKYPFKYLLDMLNKEGLLFDGEKGYIIPLSPNTLLCSDSQKTKQFFHGRLYYFYIGDKEKMCNLLGQMKLVFSTNGIMVY